MIYIIVLQLMVVVVAAIIIVFILIDHLINPWRYHPRWRIEGGRPPVPRPRPANPYHRYDTRRRK